MGAWGGRWDEMEWEGVGWSGMEWSGCKDLGSVVSNMKYRM